MSRRAVGSLLALYVAFAAAASWCAWSLIGRPFPGFFLSPNGVVGLFSADRWDGVRAGLRAWDRIVALDGRPVADGDELRGRVEARPPGSVLVYRVRRGASEIDVPIASRRFDGEDFALEALPFFLTGLVLALAGAAVHLARPSGPTGGFAVFGVVAGAAILRADYFLPTAGVIAMQFLIFAVAASIVHLGLVFPESPHWLRRRPSLVLVPYALAALLGAARAWALLASPSIWIRLDQASFVCVASAVVFLVAMVRRAELHATTPVIRERARVALWGLLPGMLVALGGVAVRALAGSTSAASVGALLAAWLGVGFFAFAAVKRDVFEFEIFARRTVTYGILWALTLSAYGAALVAVRALLGAMEYPPLASLPLLVLFVAILLVPGVVPAVQRRVEALLFPLHVSLLEVVERLALELSSLATPAEVAARLRAGLGTGVGIADAALYVAGERGLAAVESSPPPLEGALDALRPWLAAGRPLSIFDLRDEPAASWMARHRLVLLVPLVARGRFEGVLAVGEPPRGHVFDPEEVDALAALGSRLAITLARARAYERLQTLEARQREENRALREELDIHPGFPEIVGGGSPRMRAVFRAVDQVALSDATVLVSGETGTGKELVARAIHIRSARRDGPLVRLNCAAIPAGLIESELFGHERGAFTDAASRRRGSFEIAAGGTLLLDEVGELPLEVQGKLLRVLQEREFERLGGTEVLRVDVRVIAATHRDLRAEVAAGRFRLDLFFRLNVFPIVLPPLRERREDIAPLVRHFVSQLNAKLGKRIRDLTPESWRRLERYAWPGNVRELANVIERAIVLCAGDVMSVPPLEGQVRGSAAAEAEDEAPRPLAEVLRAVKAAAVERALEAGGNQVRAARLLGLTPPGLSRMIRELGIRS